MKTIFKSAAYIILALAAAACAKAVTEGSNEAEKRFFEAWMETHHPGLTPEEGLGIYILEEETGDGAAVEPDGYILAEYTVTDLDGNISSYTGKEVAKQLGKFDTTAYYGPKVMPTFKGSMQAGLAKAVIGMKAGGRKKVIIPGWLMSYASYDSEKEYLENSTSGKNTIYDIRVTEFTDSIGLWEKEQIGKYLKANSDIFEAMDTTDFLVTDIDDKETKFDGMYYKTLKEAGKKFDSDTTIYINYTGKLLNGLVFDTTDEKTAKDNGLYSSARSYEPIKIQWNKDYKEITMGSNSSSTISGFALALSQMGAFEEGIAVFTSTYGYGNSGSGSSIPGFSPLIFEIEVVAEPED